VLSLFTENWRCVLVILVVVVVALKTILGLDDATVDKLLWFVAGGATASATEGAVRKATVYRSGEDVGEAAPFSVSVVAPAAAGLLGCPGLLFYYRSTSFTVTVPSFTFNR
jgi:hypothetical protein